MKKNTGNSDSFESKLEALEDLVGKLEAEDVPLEEAISLYERGMAIHKECEKILSGARLRIEKLSAAPTPTDDTTLF